MAINEGFKDYILDQLRDFGSVTVKKMFGGAGIYHEGVIFGLIADDVLYFKVDDHNRGDYEQFGMGPFQPFANKPMVMSYYEVPPQVLENTSQLREWAYKAWLVSQDSRLTGKKKKKS